MGTMLGRKWKTVDGVPILQPEETITRSLWGVKTIYLGTDSQQDGKVTQFVTVVVIHERMKGGRVFYTRDVVPRIKSLRERLLKEVWMSVQLAIELTPFINEDSQLEVHVDANPNTKFKSSQYVKELTSMVVSQGFEAVLKPDSWAATHAADHVVKNRVIGR
jgi:predicted RNase H-related nuclease YkuK (DUF458 family)